MRSTCFEPGAQPAQVSTTRTKTHFWGELQTTRLVSRHCRKSEQPEHTLDELETLWSVRPPLERDRTDHRLVLITLNQREAGARDRGPKRTVGVQEVVDQQLGFNKS